MNLAELNELTVERYNPESLAARVKGLQERYERFALAFRNILACAPGRGAGPGLTIASNKIHLPSFDDPTEGKVARTAEVRLSGYDRTRPTTGFSAFVVVDSITSRGGTERLGEEMYGTARYDGCSNMSPYFVRRPGVVYETPWYTAVEGRTYPSVKNEWNEDTYRWISVPLLEQIRQGEQTQGMLIDALRDPALNGPERAQAAAAFWPVPQLQTT